MKVFKKSPIEDETSEEQEDIVSEDSLNPEENPLEETSEDQPPVAEDNLNVKEKKKKKEIEEIIDSSEINPVQTDNTEEE